MPFDDEDLLQCVLTVLSKRKILNLDKDTYEIGDCGLHVYSDSPGIVYKHLNSEPVTTVELQEITGLSRRAVQLSMKKLCDCGLADKIGAPFGMYVYKRRE